MVSAVVSFVIMLFGAQSLVDPSIGSSILLSPHDRIIAEDVSVLDIDAEAQFLKKTKAKKKNKKNKKKKKKKNKRNNRKGKNPKGDKKGNKEKGKDAYRECLKRREEAMA